MVSSVIGGTPAIAFVDQPLDFRVLEELMVCDSERVYRREPVLVRSEILRPGAVKQRGLQSLDGIEMIRKELIECPGMHAGGLRDRDAV